MRTVMIVAGQITALNVVVSGADDRADADFVWGEPSHGPRLWSENRVSG